MLGLKCIGMKTDRTQSLEQLTGVRQGAPNFSSYLVTESHRLHTVPLNEFTVENLRILIGQQLNLEYLMAIALEHLERDPWVGGDYYEGDLLGVVLSVSRTYWEKNPDVWARVNATAERAFAVPPEIAIVEDVRRMFEDFKSKRPANQD